MTKSRALVARQDKRTSILEALQALRQRVFDSPPGMTKEDMVKLICQQIDALYDKPLLSTCCEAEPEDELDPDMDTGICPQCKDNAVFR